VPLATQPPRLLITIEGTGRVAFRFKVNIVSIN
jgi:hypothetical protein